MSEVSLGGPPLELFHSDLQLSNELDSSDNLHSSNLLSSGNLSDIGFSNNCDEKRGHNFYNKMQDAIRDKCHNDTSLCEVMQAGSLVNQEPFSSMIALLTGPYGACQANIPEEQRQAAYNAFVSTTGYIPPNVTEMITTINDTQKSLAGYTAVYIFLILFTLCVVVLILLVAFQFLTWQIAVLMGVVAFIVLVGISVAYYFGAQRIIDDQANQVTSMQQNNFENSIAYWPQGLFAVASALSATGGTGSWPCYNQNNDSKVEIELSNDDEHKVPKMPKVPKIPKISKVSKVIRKSRVRSTFKNKHSFGRIK